MTIAPSGLRRTLPKIIETKKVFIDSKKEVTTYRPFYNHNIIFYETNMQRIIV
jgi:hypothetical protein